MQLGVRRDGETNIWVVFAFPLLLRFEIEPESHHRMFTRVSVGPEYPPSVYAQKIEKSGIRARFIRRLDMLQSSRLGEGKEPRHMRRDNGQTQHSDLSAHL